METPFQFIPIGRGEYQIRARVGLAWIDLGSARKAGGLFQLCRFGRWAGVFRSLESAAAWRLSRRVSDGSIFCERAPRC